MIGRKIARNGAVSRAARIALAALSLSLPAALLSGCITVEQRAEPTPEPWIVTSSERDLGSEGLTLITEYTIPGGGVGRWSNTFPNSDERDCWARAFIGGRLPDCMLAPEARPAVRP